MRFIPALLLLAVGLVVAPSSADKEADSKENSLLRLPDKLLQLLTELKLTLTFSKLSQLCGKLIDLGLVMPVIEPKMKRMSLLLRANDCRNVSIPLTEAQQLWEAPGFYQDRPTVIFITGWLSNVENTYSGPVAKAYKCRNDTNFVLLDAANYIDLPYSKSALNTEAIGEYLARALLQLDSKYVGESVHLVGHSLGAQIAGSAGRHYRELSEGALVARVTGLDPANPCFYEGSDAEGVRSGDAAYVDILHTNPGILGTPKIVGDADFFVHGDSPMQPGCGRFTATKVTCSHQRAVDYWTETVYPTNTNNFLGKRCGRHADLSNGHKCKDTKSVMGHDASDCGIFYVDVNEAEPFGKNANPDSYTSSNSQCGVC